MKYVKCLACKSIDVQIVTQAKHRSCPDPIEIKKDGTYFAHNSDSSWSTDDSTARFECMKCDASWPVTKNVEWTWDG